MYFQIPSQPLTEADKKTIYILLIRTNTFFSRLIGYLTKASYTHASLGVSSGGCEFYSFARKYACLPLPGGFVKEDIGSGHMGKHPQTPCALFSVSVSDEAYESLCSRLAYMHDRRRHLKYSIKGTVFCFFHHPAKFQDRYFCSQFVADALQDSGIITLCKPASLYHPMDFLRHPELSLCYEGTLGGLRSRMAAC